MKCESLTIPEVMKIFSDYLENVNDAEILQTRKMGLIILEDVSHDQSREDLIAETIENGDVLAERLLYWETYDAYYSLTHGKFDPKDSDEETIRRVREMMQPRLKLLPSGFEKTLDAFFGK